MVELRQFIAADEALLVSYLNDAAVTRYLSARLPQPYTHEAASWWVHTGSKVGVVKAILQDGALVGAISALPGEFERQKSAEMGYWVARPFWGQGIAAEALAQFTPALFLTTELVRLHASVFEDNPASAKVLEKCGFTLEAKLAKALYKNGQCFDELHYAKVRV